MKAETWRLEMLKTKIWKLENWKYLRAKMKVGYWTLKYLRAKKWELEIEKLGMFI